MSRITHRPETRQALNLEIPDSTFRAVMDTLRDPALEDAEARYLAYVLGRAGRAGVIWHKAKTLAHDLGKSKSSISRVEKRLKDKGRLRIIEHDGRTYRCPYPDALACFLEKQAPCVEEASEATQPVMEPERPLPEPELHQRNQVVAPAEPDLPPPMPEKPSVEAVQSELSTSPYTKDPLTKSQDIKASTGEVANKSEFQLLTSPVIHNPTTEQQRRPKNQSKDWFQEKKTQSTTDKKQTNPHKKNRYLVQHMASDIADTLGIHGSWKWLLKLIWQIPEHLEEQVLWAVSWVKEEIHCCRCHNAFGLLRWKLIQEGVIT